MHNLCFESYEQAFEASICHHKQHKWSEGFLDGGIGLGIGIEKEGASLRKRHPPPCLSISIPVMLDTRLDSYASDLLDTYISQYITLEGSRGVSRGIEG